MPNTLLSSSVITKEALRVLHAKLTFIGNVNRGYDKEFAQSGAKIGDTLSIRLPNRYVVRNGATLSAQDTTEQRVQLPVTTQKGVDLNFTSADLTMSLDDFSTRIITPAMAVLASAIESDVITNLYTDIYSMVGTAGTVPNTLLTYLNARRKLNEYLAPQDDNRTVHLNPEANATIVDALKGLFQDSAAIKEQYREGLMGRTSGFDWYENTLLPTFTVGNKVSGVTVNGASQTGATLNIGGVANADTFKKGQVFTIANVFQVHAETRQTMNVLQQFVVTADATMSTTTGTIAISPSITTSGALQTVNASPANSAALTFVGSASTGYAQNLAFHKDAFTFATADLVMPKGVDMAAREVLDGISMRLVRQYDINNDKYPTRLDVLYGYKTLRPELAVRITN
jgi:hypothetical protein